VLPSAERLSVLEVTQQAGASLPAVWRWQQRHARRRRWFAAQQDVAARRGTSAAQHDHRGSRPDLLGAAGETTHWSGRAVAPVIGISLRAVRGIWDAHHLQCGTTLLLETGPKLAALALNVKCQKLVACPL
jgi:hypothetical protein